MARLHNDDIRMGEASIEELLVSPISNTTFSRITDDDDTMPSTGDAVVPVLPVYGHQDYTQAIIDSWIDNGGIDVGSPGTIHQNSDVSVEIPVEYVTVIDTITYIDSIVIDDFDSNTLAGYQNDGWTFYAIYSDYTEDEVDYTEVYDVSEAINKEIIDQSTAIANAVNQHFWTDTNGVHITDDEREDWLDAVALNFSDQSDTSEHSNVLINSLGTLFRRRLNNLVSIARNAISFYTGEGNTTSDILAYFGTVGSQIGSSDAAHLTLSSRQMSMIDINNNALFKITNHAEDDGYTYRTSDNVVNQSGGIRDNEYGNSIYIFHTGLRPLTKIVQAGSSQHTYTWEITSLVMNYDKVVGQNNYLHSVELLDYATELNINPSSHRIGSTDEITFDGTVFAHICYELGIIDTDSFSALRSYIQDPLDSSHYLDFSMVSRDNAPRASFEMVNQYGQATGEYSIALSSGKAVGEASIAIDGGVANGTGSFASGFSANAGSNSLVLANVDNWRNPATLEYTPYKDKYYFSRLSLVASNASVAIGFGETYATDTSLSVGGGYRGRGGRVHDQIAKYFSAAIGVGTYAMHTSLAVGIGTRALNSSLAIGVFNQAASDSAFEIGNGDTHENPYTQTGMYDTYLSSCFSIKRNGGVINSNFITSIDPDLSEPVFFEVGNRSLSRSIVTEIVQKDSAPIKFTGNESSGITNYNNDTINQRFLIRTTIPSGYRFLDRFYEAGQRTDYPYKAAYYDVIGTNVYSMCGLLKIITSHTTSPESWTYDLYYVSDVNDRPPSYPSSQTFDGSEAWALVPYNHKIRSETVTTYPGGNQYYLEYYFIPGEYVKATRPIVSDTPVAHHLTFGSRKSGNAVGAYSTTLGTSLAATAANQLVIGKYNAANANALFIIGNGASDSSRFNTLWLSSASSGSLFLAGDHPTFNLKTNTVKGTNPSGTLYPGLHIYDKNGYRYSVTETVIGNSGALEYHAYLASNVASTESAWSGLKIVRPSGNTNTYQWTMNVSDGSFTSPGTVYLNGGASWKANTNIACPATANNQEWSIDLNGGSYTNAYFHVWSGKNSKSILRCNNDDNSVEIANGPLTCGNRITASNGNTWTSGFVVRDTRMPLTHSFSAQTDSAGFFISPELTADNFIGRMFMREYTNNVRMLILETSRTISNSRKYNGFGIGLDSSGNATYRISNGANFRSAIGAAASSDRRLKTNLTPLGEEAVEFINSLTAYQYDIGEDMWRRHEVGVIAQDVSAADPWHTKMAFQTKEGLDGLDDWEKMKDNSPTWKLDYVRLIPPLITTVQKLTKRIEELEKLIDN